MLPIRILDKKKLSQRPERMHHHLYPHAAIRIARDATPKCNGSSHAIMMRYLAIAWCLLDISIVPIERECWKSQTVLTKFIYIWIDKMSPNDCPISKWSGFFSNDSARNVECFQFDVIIQGSLVNIDRNLPAFDTCQFKSYCANRVCSGIANKLRIWI